MDVRLIAKVLANARSGDSAIRGPAEQQLKTLAETNAATFFAGMATALSTEDLAADMRQLAGLVMKTALDAQDDFLREARRSRWMAIAPEVRQTIKNLVSQTLGSPVEDASHTAAQVVAKIGSIELPNRQWGDLIKNLLAAGSKSALECLGYLCEELPSSLVSEQQTNEILYTIMKAMGPEQSDAMKKVAVTALLNTLNFASENMGRPHECKLIMESIIAATRVTAKEVRLVAFECIVRCAELYYDAIEPYIGILYERSQAGITTMEEEVARQALEFWHTLAEQELAIEETLAFDHENGEPPSVTQRNFCGKALSNLVNLLTSQMIKQSEYVDDDAWNIAMASGTCLSTLARTCSGTILDYVMPFVTAHISNEDWHYREAAILAFGSVMNGPPPAKIMPFVTKALPFLMSKITAGTADAKPAVRDTTAWTVGRILSFHYPALISYTDKFVEVLSVVLLKDEPRVAANACFCIHNMAEGMSTFDRKVNPLTKHFVTLVTNLVQCANRSDWDENNLRNSAYEALNVLIQYASDDLVPSICKLVPSVLQQLQVSLAKPLMTADDKEEQYGLQVNLCALLQAIMIRVEEQIRPNAQAIFDTLMGVFNVASATAHEEAFMAVGALASGIEGDFYRFMERFFPVLCKGLANINEHQVCYVAVGIIGDISRALEKNLLKWADTLILGLLHNLKEKSLNRSVKPAMLAAFGDIALAIGADFPAQQVQPVMQMLVDAAKASRQGQSDADEDTMEFIYQLQTSLLEGITSVVQGFNDDGRTQLLAGLHPFVADIAAFLAALWDDGELDDKLAYNCVSLIGDMAHAMPTAVAAHMNMHVKWVQELIGACRGSQDDEAVEMADWAASLLARLR